MIVTTTNDLPGQHAAAAGADALLALPYDAHPNMQGSAEAPAYGAAVERA